MLAAEAVWLRRGGRPVLQGVSLTVRPGELVAVVGPNGAGKSSLLQLLAGTLAPDRGELRLGDRRLSDWPGEALARRRAVLPQSPSLAFPFTVLEVVLLGRSAWGGDGEANLAAAAWALAETGLAAFAERRYTELSGGERQRVQLARVLAQLGPPRGGEWERYLLLDEPTNNLDLQHQRGLMQTARRLAAGGFGVLAVLHDLNVAALCADRLCLLSEGRVAAAGTAETVLSAEALAGAYGPGLRLLTDPETGRPLVLPG